MRLIPTIPTVPHMSQSVHYCQRCDYYKEIYRIWKVCAQGSLGRLLALSGTSYKWLSHCGVCPSSGPIIQFLKKTSFVQDSQISYWLQLVCSISPLLLYGFQSNLVSLESYFRGESNAVCCNGRGLLLMETSAITEIAPPGSFWRYWFISHPDFSYLDIPPHAWDVLLPFCIAGSGL